MIALGKMQWAQAVPREIPVSRKVSLHEDGHTLEQDPEEGRNFHPWRHSDLALSRSSGPSLPEAPCCLICFVLKYLLGSVFDL